MRTNKEIFETMKEKVELMWYRYYRAVYKYEHAENLEDKNKWESRKEKRGNQAESMTMDYNSLLASLGINYKLDMYELQTSQLKEVYESYQEVV